MTEAMRLANLAPGCDVRAPRGQRTPIHPATVIVAITHERRKGPRAALLASGAGRLLMHMRDARQNTLPQAPSKLRVSRSLINKRMSAMSSNAPIAEVEETVA